MYCDVVNVQPPFNFSDEIILNLESAVVTPPPSLPCSTGSGTEGRPGSPSSVDGRHAQDRNTSNTNTNVIDASEEDVRSGELRHLG